MKNKAIKLVAMISVVLFLLITLSPMVWASSPKWTEEKAKKRIKYYEKERDKCKPYSIAWKHFQWKIDIIKGHIEIHREKGLIDG